MKLRYIGAQATTFIEVGEIEPGATFDVPDDQASAYLSRPDVEEAASDTAAVPEPASPGRPRRASKTADQNDAAAAAPEEG